MPNVLFKSQLGPLNMGKKPEAGTPKALSNAMKSKGMQKRGQHFLLTINSCYNCPIDIKLGKMIPASDRYNEESVATL